MNLVVTVDELQYRYFHPFLFPDFLFFLFPHILITASRRKGRLLVVLLFIYLHQYTLFLLLPSFPPSISQYPLYFCRLIPRTGVDLSTSVEVDYCASSCAEASARLLTFCPPAVEKKRFGAAGKIKRNQRSFFFL